MITKELAYEKAFQNKALVLREKERSYQNKLSLAYTKNARLGEIDAELSAAGASLAITALSGNKQKLSALKKQVTCLSAEKNEILKNAGATSIVYDCDLCKDTGYVSGKVCSCIKCEAAKVLAENLSAQMPLENSRFDNFDLKYYSDKTDAGGENPRRRMTSILKLCREYAINFDPALSENLLFMGNTGIGKTHLTLAIAGEVIKKGYLAVYSSCENLFSVIEAEKFSGEGRGNYDAILGCDLLVMDDLGAEMTTQFTKAALYNIINTRLLSGKPTIINTNLSMKEIETKYSQRISSRLIGEYNCNKFLGDDIRQQKLFNK